MKTLAVRFTPDIKGDIERGYSCYRDEEALSEREAVVNRLLHNAELYGIDSMWDDETDEEVSVEQWIENRDTDELIRLNDLEVVWDELANSFRVIKCYGLCCIQVESDNISEIIAKYSQSGSCDIYKGANIGYGEPKILAKFENPEFGEGYVLEFDRIENDTEL